MQKVLVSACLLGEKVRYHGGDAALGHPVVGDVLYGGEAAAVRGLLRHALHAARIAFDAPGGGRIEAESPLPAELQRLVEELQ